MKRPPVFSVVLWIIAAAMFVAVGAWWVFLRSDVPARAALPGRSVDVSLPGGEIGAVSSASIDGEWQVRRAPDVFAGYRVTEQWAAEQFDKAAVARTPDVSGRLHVREGRAFAARIEVDMTTLDSGQSARDALMRTKGLESDQYPTAKFELAEPVDLPDHAPGAVVEMELVGDLTLHGRTNEVLVRLDARWSGGTIDLAGNVSVHLADFGIDAPSTPFITVADTGEIEFQVTFVRT
jgi:polyisoprenoid-binding protein YceI